MMFCAPFDPTRQTGLAVVGFPAVKLPLLQVLKVAPDTAPAVSRADWPLPTPPGTAVPLPLPVAVIDPEDAGVPPQFPLPKSCQVTGAVPTPDVFTFTLPSVKVVVAGPDASPVAVTS